MTHPIQNTEKFRAWLCDLSRLTDINDHSGAVIALVKEYPAITGHLIGKAELVKVRHQHAGCMLNPNKMERDRIAAEAERLLLAAMPPELHPVYHEHY